MSEAIGRYALAFGAPMPVREIYGAARKACFMDFRHHMEPGNLGLNISVNSGFDLEPEAERRFFLRIDQLVRNNRLEALEPRFGSIHRFHEPEDVICLEVGGEPLMAIVEYLLADLESLGVPRAELPGRTLHVELARRGEGQPLELQDLAFGVCADVLCRCRKDLTSTKLNELILYDRILKHVARSWTLRRH